METPILVWLRRNLRLRDNAAIDAAARSGRPIVFVYIVNALDDGGASRWWLHHSLAGLDDDLRCRGSRLVLRKGDAAVELPALVEETGAGALHLTRRYEPRARAEQQAVRRRLEDRIDVRLFDDSLLLRPGDVLTQAGAPYKVFTPYYRAATAFGPPDSPLPAPDTLQGPQRWPRSLALDDLALLPTKPDWAGGLRDTWSPGETAALEQLDIAASNAARYAEVRDRPDLDQTTRLSPRLHFGELSPRQVWHAVRGTNASARGERGTDALLRQLVWREFSYYLLHHFPALPCAPLRPEFEYFPWQSDDRLLRAWQTGATGYPIVDAGMRQLWHSGWMHNRVRMIVASFLVKNLMIDWQTGAEWFLDTLVDADLANNSAGWQWVAGCGTDAAPYFRIFNPLLQSRKFDPDGSYIRRWVPELAALPNDQIHEPSGADGLTLNLAGIRLGTDYPLPIVDLASTRQEALAAYRELRGLLQSTADSPGSSAG
ncbi:MAG: deoxyribodipyrimidine photo-lyase [Woeseiaceae bacterium]|nr:deoxyribodipyrimidine photo-lyase [Woeseiaceae bacterium]